MDLKNLMAMQLQPKGSIIPFDTDEIIKQAAAEWSAIKNNTNQEEQQNKSYLSPEEQELRQNIVKLVQNQLMPIEQPKQATIQDIFNAQRVINFKHSLII